MRAGKLDRTIEIQHGSVTNDDYGTPISTWVTLATLRAEKLDDAIGETVQNDGERTERIVNFRTRFFPGVTVADRIVFESQPYNLREVKEIGRRRGLELKAERVGP